MMLLRATQSSVNRELPFGFADPMTPCRRWLDDSEEPWERLTSVSGLPSLLPGFQLCVGRESQLCHNHVIGTCNTKANQLKSSREDLRLGTQSEITRTIFAHTLISSLLGSRVAYTFGFLGSGTQEKLSLAIRMPLKWKQDDIFSW